MAGIVLVCAVSVSESVLPGQWAGGGPAQRQAAVLDFQSSKAHAQLSDAETGEAQTGQRPVSTVSKGVARGRKPLSSPPNPHRRLKH